MIGAIYINMAQQDFILDHPYNEDDVRRSFAEEFFGFYGILMHEFLNGNRGIRRAVRRI